MFFPALIHLPQACLYDQLLFFFGNSVNVYFRGDLQYSPSISLTLQSAQKLKGCFILKKKGQYFKDNIFLSFIKHYGRQVFPHEKEVKVLLLTRKVCFRVVF